MNEDREGLHIFISHKSEDKEAARDLQSILGTFGGDRLVVDVSEDIPPGTDWLDWIREHLMESHMLLLLFTDPKSTWDWCLYEAGLFTDLRAEYKKERRQVICIHDPENPPPAPLRHLHTLSANVEAIKAWLMKLFGSREYTGLKRPLSTKFAQNEEMLNDQAIKIRDLVVQDPWVRRYPPKRLQIALQKRTQMSSSRIPDEATVTADNLTLSAFGLIERGADWTWKELLDAWRARVRVHDRGDVDDRWVKELGRALFSARKDEAIEPPQVPLRSVSDGKLYLAVLYRVEKRQRMGPIRFGVLLVESKRGTEIPEDLDVLLSAVVLATRFRYEVLERFIPKLKHVRSPATREDYCLHVGHAVRSIERDASVCRLLRPRTLMDNFSDQQQKTLISEIYEKWDKHQDQIFEAIDKNDASTLWKELEKVESLNSIFLRLVTDRHHAMMMENLDRVPTLLENAA